MHKRRALAFIFVTVLLDSIGFGIILPVMPELIMDVTGEPLAAAARYGGWLLFVYALMQFFSAPLMGNLSDRFGRRPVLLGSLVAFACNYVLMGWAPTLAWLFVGRFIAGVSASTYGTANAYIADIFPPEERAQNFALMGAAFGVGFIIGPVIGGLLGETGPRVPFYATACIAFSNALYGLLVLPESLTDENRRAFDMTRANPLGAIRQLSHYPMVLGLATAYLVYLVGHHALPTTWAYFVIEKFSWTSRQIGFSLGVVGVLMLVMQGYVIRLVIPILGPARTAYLGMALTMLSFLGYAFAQSAWQLYVFLVIGAAQGFIGASIQGIMSGRVPANAQGELQGAIGSIASLAAIIGPLTMSQLFAYYSDPDAGLYFPGAAYLAAAALTLIAMGVLSRTVRRGAPIES
jgi:DHA1 family tetracycline resistance protein-like MFS transporter